MKKSTLLVLLMTVLTGAAHAADLRYRIRVDGLACPYCAYGIEKKLRQIEGVKEIEVDLERGIVIVHTASGVDFTDEQLARLFADAGFTYRSMKRETP